MINTIISSPVVSSFRNYGNVREVGLYVNNFNLLLKYGESLYQVNRISLISREPSITIHTKIDNIFTNPIDISMIRFMNDKAVTNTLISDNKYELVSHSLLNASKKLRDRDHVK